MKVMGKRRIGELEADELVSTLLISELGAMPISDSNIPLINAVVPIIFICALEVLLSAVKTKWHCAKHILEGEPTYIIYKGKISPRALEKSRLSINEVIAEMRSQGIGNISDVYYGILEANGKLSLIESDGSKRMAHTLIIDGEIHKGELAKLEKDERWLEALLKKEGAEASEILLLSITDDEKIQLIKKDVPE